MTLLEGSKSYKLFVNDIQTARTKEIYTAALKAYCSYKKVKNVDDLLRNRKNPYKIEDDIKEYIGHLKKEGFSWSYANIAKSALVLYYDTNRVDLNSKRISRSLGEHTISTRDIPYSREQIQKLLEFADLKYKAVILLLSSTSMRLGALADPDDSKKFMKIGDLEEVEDLYRVHVYPDSEKYNYWTFCTPEARKAIEIYLKSREDAGENVTKTSPLFRTVFPPGDPNKNVKPVAYDTFKTQIRKYLIKAGLLEKKVKRTAGAPRGSKREGVQLTTGLRKYGYNMLAKSGMDLEVREILVGHRTLGVQKHYLRYTDEDLLKQFKMAISNITISDVERKEQIIQDKDKDIKQQLANEEELRKINEKEIADLKRQISEIEDKAYNKAMKDMTKIADEKYDPIIAGMMEKINKTTKEINKAKKLMERLEKQKKKE